MSADSSLIQVRLLGADEHAELKEVRLSALAYSDLLVEHLARESAAPLDFWRDRAARGAAGVTMVTFIAVGESGFTGVVDGFLSEDGGTVEVGGMWVSPSVRRLGIGRALLRAVCEWGRERGAQRASLWVRAANGPACLLYEREGFGVAKRSDESGETGLRLERRL
jgi:GNAT superfamily N-acetyltransferase